MLFPSPTGRPFTQAYAHELAADSRRLVILCGHYEGIDERVRLSLRPEEIVGDGATGGELPAPILIDAASRLVPGVLAIRPQSSKNRFPTLVEYLHIRGRLRFGVDGSGGVAPDTTAIRRWRRKEALRTTYESDPIS
jgi:tRNA (guanine37-N1)-methyltransferase